MMPHYKLLEWDSVFFGFTVARITTPDLDATQLPPLIDVLRKAGVHLAYWPASSTTTEATLQVAAELGGRLVDRKITFFAELTALPPAGPHTAEVVPYAPPMPVAELEALAVQCGSHSRFAVDPSIPRQKFIELYRTWMNRSLRKEIASEVLVIREQGMVAGVITLGAGLQRGLVAVHEQFRGRGFGESLVRAGQRWRFMQGERCARKVTQQANAAACRLYTKCGYSVEKTEPFVHFWL